jgi:hypothetical protein
VRIEILDQAELDLVEGFHFYETQREDLGAYFLDSLYSDIELLRQTAGIHLKPHKAYYRALSKRFPFAIYYTLSNETVFIHAVVDCRRDPARSKRKLGL